MDIIIAAGGMPFGPKTAEIKSLGGSETAAWQLAERLAEQGQHVTIFSQLPDPSQPDHVPHGTVVNGVRWMHIEAFQQVACGTPHDLLIAQRDPRFVSFNTQSKKKVLWVHDIATHRGMRKAIDNTAFAFDEIWTVSEWHRQQVHEVTKFPLDSIVALRNGIVHLGEDFYDDLELIERDPQQFFYGARPERGLISLVRPGGIMSHLPECTLKVAMYEHFPEHMTDFYNQIFAWVEQAPNVEYVGGLSLKDMRRTLKESVAYIYPTAFEETSCIIAREAIETGTPFLTTKIGALPETLNGCGVYYEDWAECEEGWEPDYNDDEFCQQFAEFVRASLTEDHPQSNLKQTVWSVHDMAKRVDLYWDGVADLVIQNAEPKQSKQFSRAWSLVQDGDVIAAEAWLQQHKYLTPAAANLYDQIREVYPFVYGDRTMEDHYEYLYASANNDELEWTTKYNNHTRINEVKAALRSLPPGSNVLEFGCGAGHMIAPLSIEFPNLNFVGFDIAQSCVDVINAGAKEHEVENLAATRADQDNPLENLYGTFDFAYCSEVLEHVIEPWALMEHVEKYVKEGGYLMFTVPFGPWEPMTFTKPGQWDWRAHLWQIDKQMIDEMIDDKEDTAIASMTVGVAYDGRSYGNYIFTYQADHKPIPSIDPVAKAERHHSRQTVAAAIIAYNNADTIEKMLDSIDLKVQHVKIAHGPSTDRTREIIDEWFSTRPAITYEVVDVPRIQPPKEYGGEGEGFGFDDARNASVEGLDDYDWILWIDTDEYLVGNISPLLRQNTLDSYLITQHHFTVEPRGEPAQLDRPARLIRTTSGFKCLGHIHEHFEVPDGGPGRGFLLPNVDIGHTGYENEATRRERFKRNFPFLQWDHDNKSERKLHSFLWFRDIVHRVRYYLTEGRQKEAFDLANEGLAYYNDNWERMSSFGPGTFQALEYVAELNGYLDNGLGVVVGLQLDEGKSLQFNTKLTDYEQLQRVIHAVLKDEYADRASRYY